jgi:predicted deacetylase
VTALCFGKEAIGFSPWATPILPESGAPAEQDFFALVRVPCATEFQEMESAAAIEFLPGVATPSVSRDFLVVSIHDVAPSNREIVDNMIVQLRRRGVSAVSLLVVPDYHHQGASVQDRQFVSWLRDLESQGNEIVIHGYFHERPRRPNETMRDKFFTRFYTDDEGEFYDLDYEEALRRITFARNQFREGGLKPRGFVAPAWLLGAEAERAARDAEMEYTTRVRSVRDLRSGENFPARSLVYSVRTRWRRALSPAWNAALFRFLKHNPLMRISIHPPDYSHPAIWEQIVDLISRTEDLRTPTTYQDWIAKQRLKRGL